MMKLSKEVQDKLIQLSNEIDTLIQGFEFTIEEVGTIIIHMQEVKFDLNSEWRKADCNPINENGK